MKLYEIHQDLQNDFIRFAYSLTHSQADAEDLVQQAYLKAMDQDDLFDYLVAAQIKGWFFTTIKNMFIDKKRKDQRLVMFEPEHLGHYDVSFDEGLFIQTAMQVLNDSDRRILELRYLGATPALRLPAT